MARTVPTGKYPVNSQVIYSEVTAGNDRTMTTRELRQAWIRHLIAEHCDGKNAAFARRIGKDNSYVSRMLSPEEKSGAKGIGEDTVRVIFEAFPDAVLSYQRIVGDWLSNPGSQPARLSEETLEDALKVIRGAAELQGADTSTVSAREIAIAYALLEDSKERVSGANIIRLVKAFIANYQGETSNESA